MPAIAVMISASAPSCTLVSPPPPATTNRVSLSTESYRGSAAIEMNASRCRRWSGGGGGAAGDFRADHRCDLGPETLDLAHDVGVRDRSEAHVREVALVAE